MRVVYVIPVLRRGGTERFLMNLLSVLPKSHRCSIVCYDSKNDWVDELSEWNTDVTVISKPSEVGILKNIGELIDYFRKVQPDAVCAYTFYNAAYVLMAAKICGTKVRIAHAHTSVTEHKKSIPYKIYSIFSKVVLSLVATNKLACSDTAGKALFFGHNYEVVNNGIDLLKYKFNGSCRKEYRKKLAVKDSEILIGSVGRFDNNKNQIFMIKILEVLLTKSNKFKLLLLGGGEGRERLMKYVEDRSLSRHVIFGGIVDNAHDYYNAMDIFLLTSFSEGLPFVLIEAQANGLPIFASSNIDSKSKLNENFKFLDLDDGANRWANEIMSIDIKRQRPNRRIEEYSIEKTVARIEEIYES